MSGSLSLGQWRCPGVFREIEEVACPSCSEEVEFFPQDLKRDCANCGMTVARLSSSCLEYCPSRQSKCYREMVRQKMINEKTGT